MKKYSKVAEKRRPYKDEKEKFPNGMNSYLGLMKHYKSYNVIKKGLYKYIIIMVA